MSEIVNQSLQKIAKGTSIIFIGTVFIVRYIAYFNFRTEESFIRIYLQSLKR